MDRTSKEFKSLQYTKESIRILFSYFPRILKEKYKGKIKIESFRYSDSISKKRIEGWIDLEIVY